ncbi:MAG: 50S ribosomal protein L11 methyltransferase, partial [Candidatus Aenigmarchaeota archaeon]|nr:50S ribosomal protein L11 methyltransferase [Candidatus Aenigmarchaeota archaeon]
MSIRKIKSKKDLEIVLQSLEIFSNPKPHLEQYSTPSSAAATLLWKAYMDGEIFEKVVYDLGCGTGILSIGAMLLGARKVVGVDLDADALRIARKNALRLGVNVSFVREDVKDLEARADVVVQNPPFGSQRKGNDRIFIEKSLEIA